MGDWLFAVGLGLWGSVPVGLGLRVIAWGLFPVGRDDDLRSGTRLLRWVLGLLRLSHHLGLIPVSYWLWVSILEFFFFFTLLQTHTVKYFSEYFPKCKQTSEKKSFVSVRFGFHSLL